MTKDEGVSTDDEFDEGIEEEEEEEAAAADIEIDDALELDDSLEIDDDLEIDDEYSDDTGEEAPAAEVSDEDDEDDGDEDTEEIDEDVDEVDDLDDDEEDETEESLEVLLGRDQDDGSPAGGEARNSLSIAANPIGEGEFTCRSCFLVKRRAQLADPKKLICLDCA